MFHLLDVKIAEQAMLGEGEWGEGRVYVFIGSCSLGEIRELRG
jgi:hypothetical protein